MLLAGTVLIGAGVARLAPTFMPVAEPTPPEASATPTPTAGELADAAAHEFIDAIVSGDAVAAFATAGAGEETFLTDEAWRQMLEVYPPTDIAVTTYGDDSGSSFDASASYWMNDQLVDFSFTVLATEGDPESTRIIIDLPRLEFDTSLDGFELSLNGVTLPDTSDASYLVLPGAYALETTSPYFHIDSSPILAESGSEEVDSFWFTPELTDEGIAKFRELVRASAEACVGSTMLDAGCGLAVTGGLEGGGSLVDGTVERRLDDDQWATIDAMTPRASSFDNPIVQEGELVGPVDFFADWQRGGGSGRDEIHGGPWLYTPHVDFSDPALPVTWE